MSIKIFNSPSQGIQNLTQTYWKFNTNGPKRRKTNPPLPLLLTASPTARHQRIAKTLGQVTRALVTEAPLKLRAPAGLGRPGFCKSSQIYIRPYLVPKIIFARNRQKWIPQIYRHQELFNQDPLQIFSKTFLCKNASSFHHSSAHTQYNPNFQMDPSPSALSMFNWFKWTLKALIQESKYFASRFFTQIAGLNSVNGPFC